MKGMRVRVRLETVEDCAECTGWTNTQSIGLGHVCFDMTLRMARSGKPFEPKDYVIKDPHSIPDWCPLKLVDSNKLYVREYGPDKRKKGEK